MAHPRIHWLLAAGLILATCGDGAARTASPARQVRPATTEASPASAAPLVADDSEIPALERDAVAPALGSTLPRCVQCAAPVWPRPVTERWRFRLHLVLDASGKVGTSRIVQTLVGDPAARPISTAGDVAPGLRESGSARAGLAVLAATRRWQFAAPSDAPLLLVTDLGVGDDVPVAPTASFPRQAPLKVGGEIPPPTKLVDVRPVYPPEAIAARVTGVVTIEARIGPTGEVEDARVLSGVPLLDDPALVAVRQWRYTPTLVNGDPVAVVMTVTVTFSLSRQ